MSPILPSTSSPFNTLPKAVYWRSRNGVGQANEELAAGGIGMLGAGHGEDAAHMWLVVELGLDLVARVAGAPATFRVGVLGQRIAALDHEAFHDAVKGGAIVESLRGPDP